MGDKEHPGAMSDVKNINEALSKLETITNDKVTFEGRVYEILKESRARLGPSIDQIVTQRAVI